LTNYDPKKIYELKGDFINDEDFERALNMLRK
jgi:hypothetical protein